MSNNCLCGHAQAAHEHFRAGSDCGVCTAEHCPRFRSDNLLNRLLDPVLDRRLRQPAADPPPESTAPAALRDVS